MFIPFIYISISMYLSGGCTYLQSASLSPHTSLDEQQEKGSGWANCLEEEIDDDKRIQQVLCAVLISQQQLFFFTLTIILIISILSTLFFWFFFVSLALLLVSSSSPSYAAYAIGGSSSCGGGPYWIIKMSIECEIEKKTADGWWKIGGIDLTAIPFKAKDMIRLEK